MTQSHDTHPVSPDQTVSNGEGLSALNLEALRHAGEVGVYLADVYQIVIAQEHDLATVRITPSGRDESRQLAHTGGFAHHKDSGDGLHHEVVINTHDGWEHYRDLMQTRPIGVKLSAEKAGVPLEQFDEKILAAFIFAHELGHSLDYLRNWPNVEDLKRERVQQLATLPWPGYTPPIIRAFFEKEVGKQYLRDKADAMQALGITVDTIVHRQEVAYRATPFEDFADRFAARILAHLPYSTKTSRLEDEH